MVDFVKKKRGFEILILDYMNLYYKYSWAFRFLENSQGEKTGILYGFYDLLTKLKFKHNPSKIIICMDGYDNFRKSIDPDYKADRNKKSDWFFRQDKILKKSLTYFFNEVILAYSDGYEADDIAAYFVNKFQNRNILLYSNDTDWLNFLINDNIKVYRKLNNKPGEYNREQIKKYINKKFGVELEDYNLFCILNGNKHNNSKCVFRKPKALQIIKYIKEKEIKIENFSDLLNSISDIDKIKLTDEIIEKLEINYRTVKIQNKGFKIKQIKSVFNLRKNKIFLKKYELKKIQKILKM